MKKTLAIIGVLFLLFVLYILPFNSNSKETRPDITAYKTADVKKGKLTLKISATGVVEPNFQVEVKSKASGEVLKFHFEEGDRIQKGTLLLQLDKSDELRAVSRAEADEQSSTANLKKAETTLLRQKTKYDTDLKTARSAVESAEASLRESEEKLKRQRDLFEKKFASREALDEAETTFKVNRENLFQARAQLQDAEDAVHDIAIRENEVELAKAEFQRTRIALDEARERLEETEIFAPIDGVIIKKLVEEGQIIASGISNVGGGTALANIADMSRLFVIADIDETDIGSVTVGQRVIITTDAFLGKKFRGKVTRIAPQGEVESSITIFKVKIEALGKDKEILKPMMTANVDLIVKQAKDTVYIPGEAVRREDGRVFAVLLEGDTPREVPITVGFETPIHTQVLEGLATGQKVIVGDWKQAEEDAEALAKKGSTLRKILWMLRSK